MLVHLNPVKRRNSLKPSHKVYALPLFRLPQ
jgi:hypothetical protein